MTRSDVLVTESSNKPPTPVFEGYSRTQFDPVGAADDALEAAKAYTDTKVAAVDQAHTQALITSMVGTTGGTIAAGDDARLVGAAQKAQNLSDLTSPSTARSNLGLGSAATRSVGTAAGTVAAGDDARLTGAAQKAQNLSDLTNPATARSNLGLGSSATANVGSGAGTVAAGDDARLTGAAQKAQNLADLANPATARSNLGLGSAAVANIGSAAGTVASGTDARLSDARTPTVHAASHASGGSDPIDPAGIGAVPLAGGTLTGSLTAGNGAAFYGAGSSAMPPSANNLLGWSYDPAAATSNITLTAGVVHMSRVWIGRSGSVTNLAMRTVSSGGSGLVNSYMGLYDAGGNRLGLTADLSANWMGATGNRVHPLTAGVPVVPGWYFVAWLIGTFTTSPGISRSTLSDVHNVNLSPAQYRSGTIGSGLTALPATLTLANMTSFASFLWAGVA